MDIFDLIIDPYLHVRSLWIISFLLIIWMSRSRIRSHITREWDIKYQFFWPFHRNIFQSLARLYVMIESTNSFKLAELVREEFCINSSVAFHKPISYFIRYRTDKKELLKYFQDKNLIELFLNPKIWAIKNGGIKYSFFGLKKENIITKEYLNKLNELISTFALELYMKNSANLG